jgi:hypothetical protein
MHLCFETKKKTLMLMLSHELTCRHISVILLNSHQRVDQPKINFEESEMSGLKS